MSDYKNCEECGWPEAACNCPPEHEQAPGPLDATACSPRGKANAAWNKLNFALSLLHHGGAHLQATTLIMEARELCDEIVHDPRAENASDQATPRGRVANTPPIE